MNRYAVSLLLLAGCASNELDAKNAEPASAARPPRSPAAASASTAEPSDEAPVTPLPIPKAFGGEDPGVKRALEGKKAWAYEPGEGVGLKSLKSVSGTTATLFQFTTDGETFESPLAFVAPAAAPKLAVGDVVLVTVVSSGVCGVVREVSGDQAEVRYDWGTSPQSRMFPREELLRLGGELTLGAPTLIRKDDSWSLGTFLFGDKSTAWVGPASPGGDEKKVALSEVRPLDLSSKLKPKDKVLACDFMFGGCIETDVVAAQLGGLRYELTVPEGYDGAFGDKKTFELPVCQVGRIPKK